MKAAIYRGYSAANDVAEETTGDEMAYCEKHLEQTMGSRRDVAGRHDRSVALAMVCLLVGAIIGCRLPATPRTGPGHQPNLPQAELAVVRTQPPPEGMTWSRSSADYGWLRSGREGVPIVWRFPEPPGFSRAELGDGSWGQWLRHLPLKPHRTPVVSLSGDTIVAANSPLLGAVLEMDVRRNLECADVILRLRAEYLRWAGREADIVFPLSGEGEISWPEWKRGMRPRLQGYRLRFYKTATPDGSRANFERYLDAVFAWCGTYSVAKAGKSVATSEIQVGDFFIHAGSPGHTVLVVDLAPRTRGAGGNLKGLLLQGFMPAQSPHVLAPGGDEVWFDLVPGEEVDTPFWGAFKWSELRRFKP